MRISSNFDGGNIEVVNAEVASDIQLTIKKDNGSDFFQWFYFRVEHSAFITQNITISGLKKSAYPDAWDGYQAVASYDREEWFRVETRYDEGSLHIQHTPEHQTIYYAYFAPYSYDRHLDLLAWAQSQFQCTSMHLGETLDGRDMTALKIGFGEASESDDNADKKVVWITARQHPGETMAEWLVEGLLERLLDADDPMATSLLEKAVFYVVPNMNPDGSVRGHLRTNAIGVNLNREWHDPQELRSPEVFHVLKEMEKTGVDLFLDIHGDEAIPYNFLAGSEGNSSYTDRLAALEKQFSDALLVITPEFQDKEGYSKEEKGTANMTVATNAMADKFDCLAFTLEMPFKDNDGLPDPAYGWSPYRSKQLGQDLLVAVHQVMNNLR